MALDYLQKVREPNNTAISTSPARYLLNNVPVLPVFSGWGKSNPSHMISLGISPLTKIYVDLNENGKFFDGE